MKHYTHLFFDLDHTLWDYERNSEETLKILCEEHQLYQREDFILKEFIDQFTEVNESLWIQYHAGKINQE